MKYKKYVTAVAFIAISITSFTSCDKISGNLIGSVSTEEKSEVNSDNGTSDVSTDSIKNARKDSLEQIKRDSLARIEIAQQTKEIEDKLSSQSDSINYLNTKVADLEKKSEGMMDKSSAFTFMVVEFVLFLLIVWYLYSKLSNRIKKMKSRLHYLEKSKDDSSEMEVNRMIQTAINDLAKQINRVNKNQDEIVNKIDRRVSKLEDQNDAYSHYAQISSQQLQPEIPQKKEEVYEVKTFYMPRTRTDLQFEDNKRKPVKDETTYFKFTIIASGKAEFTFEPLENNIIGAYDDRENSLVTVCEIDSKSSTPRKYKNIKPGEAKLIGNIWHVTSKLKLEYV